MTDGAAAGLTEVSYSSMGLGLAKIKTDSTEVSCGGGLGREKSCTSSVRGGGAAARQALGALGSLSLTSKGVSSDVG